MFCSKDERPLFISDIAKRTEHDVTSHHELHSRPVYACPPSPDPDFSSVLSLLAAAIAYAEPIMSRMDVSHDWNHIKRVLDHARTICDSLPSDIQTILDRELVEAGCVLHDVADHKYFASPGDSLEDAISQCMTALALSMNDPAFLESERATKLAAIIQRCSWSAQLAEEAKPHKCQPVFLELLIVRDADRLDALGAIGNMRAFATASRRGSPMTMPSTMTLQEWADLGYPRLPEDGSLVGHYYAKLFHLPRAMYTEKGRLLARDSMCAMTTFVSQAVDCARRDLIAGYYATTHADSTS